MKKYIAIAFISVLFFVITTGCIQYSPNQINQTNESNKTGVKIANPAAVFCIDKGFGYEIRTTNEGQAGYCILNENIECDEWAFYRNECPTCNEWCETQPHILCVGQWEISGNYPDCNCKFVCEEAV